MIYTFYILCFVIWMINRLLGGILEVHGSKAIFQFVFVWQPHIYWNDEGKDTARDPLWEVSALSFLQAG